jgi:hypothetical protein
MQRSRLFASLAATLLVATPVTHGFTQRPLSAQSGFFDSLLLRPLRAPREYVRDGRSAQQKRPVFRGNTQVVSVDVIVRDGSGQVVRNLKASDFEVSEDGKPQEITSFTFEEISDKPAATTSIELLAGAEAKLAEDTKRT